MGHLELFGLTEDLFHQEQASDNDGFFRFERLVFYDTINFILHAKKKKNKSNHNFFIEMESNELLPVPPFSFELESALTNSQVENFVERRNQEYIIDKNYGDNVIILDAVQIVSTREDLFEEATGGLYTNTEFRYVGDSLPILSGTLLNVLATLPFVDVRPRNQISIRGQVPQIFVDRVEIDSTSFNLLASTPASDIYFIDVDRSGLTTGSVGPAIYIYTKSGNGIISLDRGEQPLPGTEYITHPGYYRAREYYAPSYHPDSTSVVKPDYRLQLYWKPRLKMQDGEVSFSFYTGDDQADYTIRIEGLTADGKAVLESRSFSVR